MTCSPKINEKCVNFTGSKFDGDPPSTISGVSSNVNDPGKKISSTRHEDNMLMNELKSFNLEVLYEKFCGAGITSDIVWDLNDDILKDCNLTNIEKLKYQKAVQRHTKKFNELI